MKIAGRLTLSHLAMVIAPVALLGLILSVVFSDKLLEVEKAAGEHGVDVLNEDVSRELEKAVLEKLSAIRSIKKGQIETYFEECRGDLNVLVEITSAVRQAAFDNLNSTRDLTKVRLESLLAGCRADLKSLARRVSSRLRDEEASRGGIGLRDLAGWAQESLTAFAETHGYQDLYLIDPDGTCFFTVLKEADQGTNLIEGAYRETGLGRLAREVLRTKREGFADLEPYAPRGDVPSAFLARPVLGEAGSVEAVVALQLPFERINAIARTRTGLGETGETYLVGPDGRMRSDARLDPQGHSVAASFAGTVRRNGCDSEASRNALAGETGGGILLDYRGEPVLSAYTPLRMGAVTWALLTEIGVEEALAPHVEGSKADLFANYAEENGYADLLLISPDGHCFHSVRHKAAHRTNLVDGRYRDTNLGRLVRSVVATKRFGFADFEPYPPGNGEPASFMAQPMLGSDGEIQLIIGLELSLAGINRIMQERTGMGESGESYLVGGDLLMRSDSLLDQTHRTVRASFADPDRGRVDTEAVRKAHAGKTGAMRSLDYRGSPVMSAFAPVNVFGACWALISGVDAAEALAVQAGMTATAEKIGTRIESIRAESSRSIRWTTGILALAFLAAGCGITFFVARALSRPIIRAAGAAKAVSEGDLTQRLHSKRSDEIGELSDALDVMGEQLQVNRASLERIDWIKTGRAELADRLRGDPDLGTLLGKIISFLAEYVDAQLGAIYVQDEEDRLKMLGSYAFERRKGLKSEIALGQGLVGQAALEKKTILFCSVPEDYVAVSSGLGETIPREILVVPCLLAEEVKAVIELGTCGGFTDRHLEFLELLTEPVAIGIHSAQSRERVLRLLEETQTQAEELQVQQEELQAANEELEEKSETLGQQSEELQAANEELEEKTEALGRQSEELQTANEELEEKTHQLETEKRQVMRKSADIEKSRAELEQKARDLARASKYKSEFLANMSHELRTPLNSLLILSENLAGNEGGNLTEDQVRSAEVIHDGGNELLNLINDILDLSKVEAGKLSVELATVDLSSILAFLTTQFEPVVEKKGLLFETNLEEDAPRALTTDRLRLEQILKNLLGNAIKFTNEGTVSLRVHRPDPTATFGRADLSADSTIALSVADTGPGIPRDKLRSIFEAFQQADGTISRSHGGTGLGLAISRELATLLCGEIQLESREGEGSTFTLYLPLAMRTNAEAPLPERVPSTARSTPAPPLAEPEPPRSASREPIPDDRDRLQEGERCLLIIEDDEAFAGSLLDLARQKGYRGLVAGDGRTGLALADRYRPSAVILDLGLPDLDGLEVLDDLKGRIETRRIPVHIVSARDEGTLCLRKGAVGHMVKPASKGDIEAVFATIESRLSADIRRVLVVDDDPVMQDSVADVLAGEKIVLTPALSGAEALEMIRSQDRAAPFDCIILDLGLGDMSGLDLLRTLRDDPEVAALPPVVIHTARDLTSEEDRELKEHSRTVVVKGASSRERLLDEVTLFLHRVDATMPQRQRQVMRMLHDGDVSIKGRKVLLVDDDLRNSFAMSKILGDKGMIPVLAENGRQAIEKLDSVPGIELVLMDLMMPVMDGLEAIRRIRDDRRFADLPIIALTARTLPEDRAASLEAGANDYLVKPVNTEKLLSVMRVWLYEAPV